MGLKKYIFFSIVLIVGVYLYAVTLQLGEYTFNQYGFELTLPIAAWLVFPVVVLLLVTILHILFYGFRSYLNIRAYEKDEESLIESIKDNLLENNNNKSFKNKGFKEIADILSQMNLVSKGDEFSSTNSDIEKIVNRTQDIKKGNYVFDKSVKFNKNGTITNLNLINKVSSEIDFCMDVLKKSENYESSLVKIAFLKVVAEKSMTTIKRVIDGITLDKEMVLKLIEKDSQNEQFSIEQAELIKYMNSVDFDKYDYLEVAKMYKKSSNPDTLISMFETLSNEKDEALSAYIFVLFEFEMLDNVRELLRATAANEYTAYKALIDLKESGRNYTVESLSYRD